MDAGIISTRYAKAIYEFALEKGYETTLYQRMNTLTDNFSEYPSLGRTMKEPTIASDVKIKLLLLASGVSEDDILKNIFHLIVQKGRAAYMQNIAIVYGEYYRKSKGIVIAKLITVEPASENTKKELTEVISKITDNSVEFYTETASDIIGGFVLEIKDMRLDASVKDQLNRLKLDLIG